MTAIVVSLLVLLIDVIKDLFKILGDSLLKACSPNLKTFLDVFPYIEDYDDIVYVLSIILSAGLFICSLYAAMLTKDSESPLKIVIRGLFASGFVFIIKDLLLLVLDLVDDLYEKIVTDGTLTLGDLNLMGQNSIGSEVCNHFIELAILIAIGFQLIALVMEIAERYVTMCVLFFLSPLAAACTASASMVKAFFSYLQMFLIEVLMLFLNVFFLGTFFKSFSESVNSLSDIAFSNSQTSMSALIILIIFHLAFLKVAREIDYQLRGMGLSTSQTGRGLWGEIVSSAMSLRMITLMQQVRTNKIPKSSNGPMNVPSHTHTPTGISIPKTPTNSNSKALSTSKISSIPKQTSKTATKALNNPAASVGGDIAKTSAAALFPELSGAGLVGASIAGGVLASSLKNADGSITKANYSKENTKGSVPVTGSDGNTYYRTAENENGGPVFGYGAPVGQSAPLSSRFSNDDIQKMGFGENATLTNNGDGSLSVTGEDGSRLGTLFSPDAYKNSQEGASSIQTSDGDTWGLYTSGNFSPSLDSDSLMNFVSESSALGSVDPITSIDTSNYASTGTLTATRRSGMTDTINSSNASSFFGGYGIDEVVSASGTSWSDYENATNKIVSSVDTSTASQGYSTVTNTDGSQTRVYDSSRWSTRDRYADYFSQGNVSFFTEEGTKKVSVENGTKKETNVFSKARRRK